MSAAPVAKSRTAREIVEAKLFPPPLRRGCVSRPALVNRLRASTSTTVTALVAPGGYGKTTLLAQWAERDARPTAWLSLDERDNDPVVLLTYLAAALERIAPVDGAVYSSLRKPSPSVWSAAVPRLASMLSSASQPFVIVLDGVDMLRADDCLAAVEALAGSVPQDSVLALAARSEPALPIARLRAEGQLFELGAADLALSERESHLLLRGAGVDASDADAAELWRRTEGWAAGLQLAALVANVKDSEDGALVDGNERYIGDWFRAEYLARLSRTELRFMRRTAVLEVMTGSLCDALLERSDSARMLERLERANMFVVPLDRHRSWYRYHRLFRDVLRDELERAEPGAAAELQTRASEWCEANGELDAAIEYAISAGDTARVALLLATHALQIYYAGRAASVVRWLDAVDDDEFLRTHPLVAAVGAWIHAARGRASDAARWAEAASSGASDATFPDGTPLPACLALLQVAMGASLAGASTGDAEIALGSRWHHAALFLEAVGRLLEGDAVAADHAFADAADSAFAMGATAARTTMLAERSLLAAARGNQAGADELVLEALDLVEEHRLGDYPGSALVFAASAQASLRHGSLNRARADLARAEQLRPLLTLSLPWYSVQARLEMARVHLALADAPRAQALLHEIDEILQRRPDLGVLVEQALELHDQVTGIGQGGDNPASLTGAELRLLPLLSTYLSFREIGQRLYISRNTVKTQAISIYRKLGVSSRAAAIERARELGLVEAPDPHAGEFAGAPVAGMS